MKPIELYMIVNLDSEDDTVLGIVHLDLPKLNKIGERIKLANFLKSHSDSGVVNVSFDDEIEIYEYHHQAKFDGWDPDDIGYFGFAATCQRPKVDDRYKLKSSATTLTVSPDGKFGWAIKHQSTSCETELSYNVDDVIAAWKKADPELGTKDAKENCPSA